MQPRLMLLAGLLLGSCAPGAAQTLATRVFVARPEQTTMLVRASLTLFAPKAPMQSRLPTKPVPRTAFLVNSAYTPDPGLMGRSLVEEDRTRFLTESRLAVVQFWRGRFELGGFASTLHMQNGQFGLPGSGDPPSNHDQSSTARSIGNDGISLVFRFGRDAQTRGQPGVWRCLSWIRGDSRGCNL